MTVHDHPSYYGRRHLRVVEAPDPADRDATGCAQVVAGWALLALFCIGFWVAVVWGVWSWM